ncbi:hypothetical protein VTH82DRAFT_6986 [Thermothelomyces myriococcoides]
MSDEAGEQAYIPGEAVREPAGIEQPAPHFIFLLPPRGEKHLQYNDYYGDCNTVRHAELWTKSHRWAFPDLDPGAAVRVSRAEDWLHLIASSRPLEVVEIFDWDSCYSDGGVDSSEAGSGPWSKGYGTAK